MIRIIDKSNCYGCSSCYSICPTDAISMDYDHEGFEYPKINKTKCINCNFCIKVCPFINNENKRSDFEQTYYAVKHRDNNIRKTSSSGGAFTAISDYILDKGGLVYGAGFDDAFRVIHKCAIDKNQRDQLKGSKYVQSKINNCFREIEEQLKCGKYVLFVGTPCQVKGLINFLEKEYTNLITMDFVCHGVPSPKFWEGYISYISEKSVLINFEFRNKKKGWHNSCVYYKTNLKEVYESLGYNQFMVIYSSHFITRSSCHKCCFTNYNRISDLTVSDFWNIKQVPEFTDDDLGISMLMVNTEKGSKVFEEIKGDFYYCKCSKEQTYQPQLNHPNQPSVLRKLFINDFNNKPIRYVLNKYAPHTFWGKVRKRLLYYAYSLIEVLKSGR